MKYELLVQSMYAGPHQYKYGFSFSILTELNGSSLNQVVKVNPGKYLKILESRQQS